MNTLRWLCIGLFAGALLSLAPSCGAPYVCGPGTCFGCCDATGACVGGAALDACGTAGATCAPCGSTQTCEVGICKNVSNGGGGGAGGGGGSGGDAGVQQPTNPLEFTVVTIPDPVQYGTNSMRVTIKGANGVRVPDATLTAKTWMPAMGHGSATPTVTNASGGDYVVSGVSFTMYGTWTVTLSATAQGGLLSGSKVFTYTVN